mgnify:CR=1 FL=1
MAVSIAEPKAEGDLWDLQPCCAQRHPNGGGGGGGASLGVTHISGGEPPILWGCDPISGVVVPISGGPDPHFLWGVIPNFGEV